MGKLNMSKESGKKKLYSFYIEPEQLDRITRLAGFLTAKGNKVTVSALINMSIDQLLDQYKIPLEEMTKLSESVHEFKKN